jgi:hypothetical protein
MAAIMQIENLKIKMQNGEAREFDETLALI